jgi:hypothetical protein
VISGVAGHATFGAAPLIIGATLPAQRGHNQAPFRSVQPLASANEDKQ